MLQVSVNLSDWVWLPSVRDSANVKRTAHGNTASHDNHEKINSWVSYSFQYEYGAPLDGLSVSRSCAIKIEKIKHVFSYVLILFIS